MTPGGTSGQLLGVDAVREFNVVTDTYGAEYGKRTGAQVSIVTASGTNQAAWLGLRVSAQQRTSMHATILTRLTSRSSSGTSLARRWAGRSAGTSCFCSATTKAFGRTCILSDVTLVPDDQARLGYVPNSSGKEIYVGVNSAVQPLLALWPVQNGPELGGGIAEAFSSPLQRIREDFGTTRVDYNISNRDLLFGVYTIDDSDANTPTANPFSSVVESSAGAGGERAGAACFFADAAEYGAGRDFRARRMPSPERLRWMSRDGLRGGQLGRWWLAEARR